MRSRTLMTKLAGRRDFSFREKTGPTRHASGPNPAAAAEGALKRRGTDPLRPYSWRYRAQLHLQPAASSTRSLALCFYYYCRKKQFPQPAKDHFKIFYNLLPNLTPLQSVMNIGMSCPFCYEKMRQWLQGSTFESRFVGNWVLAGHTPYQHISRSKLAKVQLPRVLYSRR